MHLADKLAGGVVGAWRTCLEHGRFSPGLTGAWNFAIGRAVVWMIEPSSGGRTASGLMGSLLRNRHELRDVLGSTQGFMEQLGNHPPGSAWMLRELSKCGFRGDEGADPFPVAAECIQDAYNKLGQRPAGL